MYALHMDLLMDLILLLHHSCGHLQLLHLVLLDG
jgi:hypothetical protein